MEKKPWTMVTETDSIQNTMSNYDLPAEQQNVPDDADEQHTDLQTMERAQNLADQYEEIKDRTIDDGTVYGKLEDIDSSPANGNILVWIDLPGEGGPKKFRFEKPKVWSESYDFVRWIREYGYDADSFPNMLQDNCRVKVGRDDSKAYTLVIPDEPVSVRSTLKTRFWEVYDTYRSSHYYVTYGFALGWVLAVVAVGTGLVSTGLGFIQNVGVFVILFLAIATLHYIEFMTLKDESVRNDI